MQTPRRQKCAAFTLVELLVVIAIIAILIALLLPLLKRAHDSSMNQVCKSNLRQIGMAVRMYVDDNRGRWPDPYSLGGAICRRLVGERDVNDPTSQPEIYGWSALLHFGTYLKVNRENNVWRCPAANDLLQSYKNTYCGWTLPGGPTKKWPSDNYRFLWENYQFVAYKSGVFAPLNFPPGYQFSSQWVTAGASEGFSFGYELPGPHHYRLGGPFKIDPAMGFPPDIKQLPVYGFSHALQPDLSISTWIHYQGVTWPGGGGGAGTDRVD